MIDFAVQHINLAGCTQPVAAGMGQVNPRPQRGIQNGLLFLYLNGLSQWLNGYFKAHGYSP